MLSDADSFEDITLWGRLKADWLRRFLVLQNGIPSQDTFVRVFRVLDPKQFEAVFRRWRSLPGEPIARAADVPAMAPAGFAALCSDRRNARPTLKFAHSTP